MDITKQIRELYVRLAAVHGLSFMANSAAAVTTGWSGVGHARVDAEVCEGNVLIFHEVGEWQPTKAKAMAFSNVYRWSFLEDRVRLEHLRFGADKPVYLFDLVPIAEGIWESAGPHVCRDDCYQAHLDMILPYVVFDWKITGPKKDERIRYIYG